MKSIKILLGLAAATAAMNFAAYADDLKLCAKENGHGQQIFMYHDTTPTTVGVFSGGSGVNTNVNQSTDSPNSYTIIHGGDASKSVLLYRQSGCGCGN